MPTKFIIRVRRSFLTLLVCVSGGLAVANAQTPTGTAPQTRPQATLKPPAERAPAPAVHDAELYCSGFIELAPAPNGLQIVGGDQEQEQRHYVVGDSVIINSGAQQGVRAGQEFAVVRPRGRFKTKWTAKRGALGVYTQEVGRLRVSDVKDNVSVAMVTRSCESMLFGDLLRPVPQRAVPASRPGGALDPFSNPSGKQRGRVVLNSEGRESPTFNQVVYIDLGTEDNVRVGDYLSVYRPLGTGNLSRFREEDLAQNTRRGFESERFKGGKFSIQAQRVKDPNGSSSGETVKTPEIRESRPPVPRKVVGEIIIINVQARTATAVITRAAQEIHTGDFVEVQ